MLKRIVLDTVLIAGITFLTCETVLRIVHAVRPLEQPLSLGPNYKCRLTAGKDEFDPRRLYVLEPLAGATTGGYPVRVNRFGFRDAEWVPRQNAGIGSRRILFLGDSFTFGEGLAEEDRYTNVLASLLAAALGPGRIEILNAAIPGFDAWQERSILGEIADTAAPDLVILGFCGNDPNSDYTRYAPIPLPLPRPVVRLMHPFLSFRLLAAAWDRAVRRWRNLATHEQVIAAAYDVNAPSWVEFEENLTAITRAALSKTGRAPWVMYLDAQDSTTRVYKLARAAYEKAGFTWVERESGAYQPQSPFDGHPNAATHRSYAATIYEALSRAGWFDVAEVRQ